MSNQAQAERAPMARPDGSQTELLDEVERFRYTLTLIDRFSDAGLSRWLHDTCQERLHLLCEAVNDQIDGLADAIVARKSCEPVPELESHFEELCLDMDQAAQDKSLDQSERERLIAVKKGYTAMVQNLKRLCERVNRQYEMSFSSGRGQ